MEVPHLLQLNLNAVGVREAILQIVLPVLAVFVLFFLTMYVYACLRRNFAAKGFFAEITVVAFALLLSIVVRALVLWRTGAYRGADGILYAIYTAFGGLNFEGLDTDGFEALSYAWRVVFFGSVLYTGLVAFSVIAARISYGFYSYVRFRLFALRYLFFKRDVYIFSCVTEDTLHLAEDVAAYYRTHRKETGRVKIIFAGSELGAFDRKNELHRAVMRNGFYFLPYEKRRWAKREKPLLKHLHLKPQNIEKAVRKAARGGTGRCRNAHVRIFAMKQSNALTGEEAKNSEFVFEDIRRILQRNKKSILKKVAAKDREGLSKLCGAIVDYYLLTDEEINYEHYSAVLDGLIGEVIAPPSLPQERQEYRSWLSVIGRGFQFHPLNEAVMAGHAFAVDRIAAYEAVRGHTGKFDPFMEDIDVFSEDDPAYRVLVLGFGKTAQCALSTLFAQSAYIDANNGASRFIADVYDRAAENCAGIYAYTHPLFHCIDCGTDLAPRDSESLCGQLYMTDSSAQEALYEHCKGAAGSDSRYDVMRYTDTAMGFPIVCFHRASCFGAGFMDMLDSSIGVSAGRGNSFKHDVRAVIVCLGSDESNIRMANALIDDFKHELFRAAPAAAERNAQSVAQRGTYAMQSLYVHIRDRKNISRLNWTERDGQAFLARGMCLFVVPFGNSDEMYSYRQMIDDRSSMRFHYIYSVMYRLLRADPPSRWKRCARTAVFGSGREAERCLRLCRKGIRLLIRGNISEAEIRRCWLDADAFCKESNHSVEMFARFFAAIFAQKGESFGIRRLCMIEKVRWNRFYMAHGWVFADHPAEEKQFRHQIREHNGLAPFETLSEEYQLFDFINVLYGIMDD